MSEAELFSIFFSIFSGSMYFIFGVAVFIAVFAAVKRSKSRSERRASANYGGSGPMVRPLIGAAPGSAVPATAAKQGESGQGAALSAVKTGGLKDERSLGSIRDDRRGDWLARQLKEEAALARRSKYDLGGAHDLSCDARKLKLSHRHDNTIDNGEM